MLRVEESSFTNPGVLFVVVFPEAAEVRGAGEHGDQHACFTKKRGGKGRHLEAPDPSGASSWSGK